MPALLSCLSVLWSLPSYHAQVGAEPMLLAATFCSVVPGIAGQDWNQPLQWVYCANPGALDRFPALGKQTFDCLDSVLHLSVRLGVSWRGCDVLETPLGCRGCEFGQIKLGPIVHGQNIRHLISCKHDLQGLADSSGSGGGKSFYLYKPTEIITHDE